MTGQRPTVKGKKQCPILLRPVLDEAFDLTDLGARRIEGAPHPRLPAEKVARLDWHNDVSRLLLDINDTLTARPDEKQRAVVIRRLRAAVEADNAGRTKSDDAEVPSMALHRAKLVCPSGELDADADKTS